MIKRISFATLFAMAALTLSTAAAELDKEGAAVGKAPANQAASLLKPGDYAWTDSIRSSHPRLFFNNEDLPAIRSRAEGVAKEDFDKLLTRVNSYPEKPELHWEETDIRKRADGGYEIIQPKYWLSQALDLIGGDEALDCAFAYAVAGDKRFLSKAKAMLRHCVGVFEWALENQMPVEWEIHHYPSSFVAYDILFNDLTAEERKQILLPLLRVTREIQTITRYGYGTGSASSGFYGSHAILWYAGLAGYRDGVNDQEAERMLHQGFDANLAMLKYRDSVAGDDGVMASACVGYAFGAYPYASINFFHTMKAATGIEPQRQFTHLKNFPLFVHFNTIPAEPFALEFGLGDSRHLDNRLPNGFMYDILRQTAHFYPEQSSLAETLVRRLPENMKRNSIYFGRLLPFLADYSPSAVKAELPEQKLRYIPSIGVTYMRSGNQPDDTFAVFRAGSRSATHQHFDEGHFTIYKNGFLALDSGTRGASWSHHLPFYYAQSVAHNTILIHMPEEPIAVHWGPPEIRIPRLNPQPFMHGGQFRHRAARAAAGGNALFGWVVNDMTGSYRAEKCALARREFIFFYPDLFLVIDRVDSVNPAYRKEWLIHSQNQPEIDGNTYRFDEKDGRLIGQVLHPDSTIVPVGGEGMEFFASGRNWELHPIRETRYMKGLVGNWRLEVSPIKLARYDLFINFLQVGNTKELTAPLPVQMRREDGVITASFLYRGHCFETSVGEAPGGSTLIRATRSGRTVCEEMPELPPQL